LIDPVEIVSGGGAGVVLTCEHASERTPPGYTWPEADARLAGTHWAFDLGAREITLELAKAIGGPAVLARFSRLFVDPNRPLDAPTLFRTEAEGLPVAMNVALAAGERERRVRELYDPFHAAIEEVVERTRDAKLVFAIHTFTPLYEGAPREVELGVLFDREDELAHELYEELLRSGRRVALNEPWSGKDGLIYSADGHARRRGLRALELEVRQDLAVDARFRAAILPHLVSFLDRFRPRDPL
jgi:predicted N-formylglutamate amidohydrolase